MRSKPGRSLRTLLLDLDGTLLDFNMTDLLDGYFSLLARRFNAESDFALFRSHMIGAVREMMANRDPRSALEDIFLDYLAPRLGTARRAVKETFYQCHINEFNDLKLLSRPVPGAERLVSRARELGYEIGLATNPVFFHAAIAARLDWAGISPSSFRFISSSENMHFCKPHAEYFAEVLAHMGGDAAGAVMVGNDPRKDMPASAAGLFTFHVSARGIPDDDGGADMAGRIEDVLSWIEDLGPVI